MRRGENPAKDGNLIEKRRCEHRVIIPIYIPNEQGYYKDAYRIFEICLLSLLKTSTSNLKVSIISNNSCSDVNEKLLKLYNEKEIDELIIENEGIGKINSVLKALRTAEERLITISDADVLFINGWEQAVVEVFKSFSKAGAVSPIPVFRRHFDLTSNIWLRYFFSKKIKFRSVKNVEALSMFGKSLGWKWLEEEFKDVIGTIESSDGTVAVMGCSHVVASYKREVFDTIPKKNASFKLESICEYEYTDLPVLKVDGYRLSTYDNYAYHMGNVLEHWMVETFNNLKMENKIFNDFSSFQILKRNYSYFAKEKIFKRILSINKIKRALLKSKGLSPKQIYNFLDKKYI